jgi:DMSO/TMAO reductase YedYZ molybdopterin-dependent catalytic subunit
VDDFTVGFPTEVALDGRPSMVAIGMNGEPLPAQHGFPARLVVPGLYGYVSATKWLSEIELTTLEAADGYWIPRGWSKEAPIKTHSRIDVPRSGQTIDSSATSGAPVAVAGVAWGGYRGVQRVEVRILPADEADELIDPTTGEDVGGADSAGEWVDGRLSEALTQSTWRQWVVEWDATPGDYRIEVRATDGAGETQTARRQQPAPDGATGYHRSWVTVRG